jgi:hypothetical protein
MTLLALREPKTTLHDCANRLNPSMAPSRRQDAFEIVNQAVGREQRLDAGVAQLGDRLMLHRENDCRTVLAAACW